LLKKQDVAPLQCRGVLGHFGVSHSAASHPAVRSHQPLSPASLARAITSKMIDPNFSFKERIAKRGLDNRSFKPVTI
jgi:hypothetical protein